VKPEQITPPRLTPLMRSRGGIVISKPRAHSPPRGHLSRLIKPKRKPIDGGVPLRELKIEWASPDAEEDCLLKVAMEPLLNNVLMPLQASLDWSRAEWEPGTTALAGHAPVTAGGLPPAPSHPPTSSPSWGITRSSALFRPTLPQIRLYFTSNFSLEDTNE
jgi:hypothetical protein